MRNSKDKPRSSKSKGFAVHVRALCFLIVIVLVYEVMNFAMEPTGYIRWVIEEVDNPKTQDGYDCLILGASLSRAAIDPVYLDEAGYSENAFNYSIPGAAVSDSYYQLKDACRHNKVKKVIFGMDYTYWCTYPDRTFLGRLVYVRLPLSLTKLEYVGRELLNKDFRTVYTTQWSYTYTKEAVLNNINCKLSDEYRSHDISVIDLQEDNLTYKGKGYFMRDNSVEPVGEASASPWITAGLSKRTEEYFSRMVRFCKDNDIELVCITTPATPSVSVLGPLEASSTYFEKICSDNNVSYIDFNLVTLDELDRSDSLYNDWGGHMSDEMAQKFSKVLAKKLSGEAVSFYSDYNELETALSVRAAR